MSSAKNDAARLVGIVACVAVLSLSAAPGAGASPAAAQFTGGAAVLVKGALPRPTHRGRLLAQRLRAIGVREVSVVVLFGQRGRAATEVHRLAGRTPPSARIAALIRALRGRGLLVRLVPLLEERTLGWAGDQYVYRGSIQPADRTRWFASYARLTEWFASLGERAGATGMTIGVELDSLMNEEVAWARVLSGVRAHFRGDVSYAMNWSMLDKGLWPRWLAALDRIGVDAWFAVDAPDSASAAELTAALASRWGGPLAALKAAYPGVSIMFAEAGIRGQPGTFARPFAWRAGALDNDGIQRRWYRGLCEWAKAEGINGIAWWQVDLDLPGTGRVMSGFNPLGRAAEDEVRRCFRAG